MRLLDSEWAATRSLAVREIRKRGWAHDLLPALLERAGHEEDESVLGFIALALRDLKDPRTTETLWRFLEDGSDMVQMTALQGLSLLGDDRVIPIAIAWYESRDSSLESRAKRSVAIFDLRLLRSREGDKAITDLLAAESSWRRRRLIRRSSRRAKRWIASHA